MAPDENSPNSANAAASVKTRPPKAVALLPAWKAEDFIDETLQCLSAQTYPHFEVIVSVDLSTDGTADICRRHALADRRFRVIEQRERLGWIGNVNALLKEADGDYFLLAFHDDLLSPDHVETLVGVLEKNPNAVIAYSDVKARYPHGKIVDRVYTEMDGVKEARKRVRNVIRQKGFWSVPNHGVFRAWAADRIGGHREHRAGEYSADWPWLLHMALLGEFVRAPGFLCFKNYKQNSLSHTWRRDLREIYGVTEDCARVVLASKLPPLHKAQLVGELVIGCLKAAARLLRERRR